MSEPTREWRREADKAIIQTQSDIGHMRKEMEVLFAKADKTFDEVYRLSSDVVRKGDCTERTKGLRAAINSAVKWPQKVAYLLIVALVVLIFVFVSEKTGASFKLPWVNVSPQSVEVEVLP